MNEKQTIIGQDLNHLFGTWKALDAEEFLEALKFCERLDEDCQPSKTRHAADAFSLEKLCCRQTMARLRQ